MYDISSYTECIVDVHPITIQRIIAVESGGNQLALNVNGAKQPSPAKSKSEAIQLARKYINRGYSVDLGLMQINSRNLSRYGITLENVFDPCVNINTGSRILHNAFDIASKSNREPQTALQVALSMYNTGNSWRGFSNGYVSKYTHHPTKQTATSSQMTLDIGDLYE